MDAKCSSSWDETRGFGLINRSPEKVQQTPLLYKLVRFVSRVGAETVRDTTFLELTRITDLLWGGRVSSMRPLVVAGDENPPWVRLPGSRR